MTPLVTILVVLAIIYLVIEIATALITPLSKAALFVIVVLTLLLLGVLQFSGHAFR
jgi:hypothetical protein